MQIINWVLDFAINHRLPPTLFILCQDSRMEGKMKIRLEKPALNNFKAYGWRK